MVSQRGMRIQLSETRLDDLLCGWESRSFQRLLIVESFGADGRHHSNEDEEL